MKNKIVFKVYNFFKKSYFNLLNLSYPSNMYTVDVDFIELQFFFLILFNLDNIIQINCKSNMNDLS